MMRSLWIAVTVCVLLLWPECPVLGHQEFRVRVNDQTVELRSSCVERFDTAFVPAADVCRAVGARWEVDRPGRRLVMRRGKTVRGIPLRIAPGGAFMRDGVALADCHALAGALLGRATYKRGEREVIFALPTEARVR